MFVRRSLLRSGRQLHGLQPFASSRSHFFSSTTQNGEQKQRRRRQQGNSALGMAVFLAAGACCCTLGYWQVQRRKWKQGLIESRTAKLHQTPVPLLSLFGEEAETEEERDIEFTPVSIRGVLHYEDEQYVGMRKSPSNRGSIEKGEKMGAFAITPCTLEDGSVVLVNRGWIPREFLGKKVFPEPADADGKVTLHGVIKNGEARPAYIQGEALQRARNDASEALFLWADLDEIAARANVTVAEGTAPLLLEATHPAPSARFPIRKDKDMYIWFYTTPETHFMYAFTWFALAAGVVAVGKSRFMSSSSSRIRAAARPKKK